MRRRLEKVNGHLLVLNLRKSGTLSKKTVHKESGTKLQKGCWRNSLRADVQFSVLRLHCPEVNSKAKDTENCRFTIVPTRQQLRLVSHNCFCRSAQSLRSSRKHVWRMWILHDRSGQLDKVMGQSIVLSEIKTEASLENDDPVYQNLLLQRYEERIKSLHGRTEWVNFAWMQDLFVLLRLDSISWLKTMENNSTQRLVVNTLFQGVTDHHSQKDGFRETPKLDPCWKLRPNVYMVNTELKLESRLWVKITLNPGSEFLMDQTNLWLIRTTTTEIPEDLSEEQALQLKVKDFACRSRAKAKPQRREPVDHSPSIIPMKERKWIDIEPGNCSPSAYEVSKKVIHLLRHSQQVQREDDGAVQFWRIKEHLQSQCPQVLNWSDDRWKACLAAGGGAKKEISVLHWGFRNDYLFPSSSRTFRTQPHWSFIIGQCCNSARILPSHLPCWMFVSSSFYHQQWIDTWRSEFKQETNSTLFQKLSDWRLEKSYMRKHACHFDHHQRSRYVTIGLEGKFHWVLQLINNEKEKLFDSHKKKLPDEQNSSNQPKANLW